MGDNTIEVTADTFSTEVLEADIPVVVDFWAAWCGPCKMIAPVLEELAAEYDQVKIAKVNVDDNQSLAQEYEVTSIPNLGFFKDGELVDRQVGFSSKEDLVDKIEAIK